MKNDKYSIDELKKGMIVRLSQLSDILDTPMILTDTKILPNDDLEGILVYFGDSSTKEYEDWFNQSKPITPVYFSSEDDVYDE